MHSEDGFTLVELLVVVVIIGILTAIAIPVFSNQRDRGYGAQIQSALKTNAAHAAAYMSSHEGSYEDLNGMTEAELASEAGFEIPDWAGYVNVVADTGSFCVEIEHADMDASEAWARSTYRTSAGAPSASPDACPAL